MAEQTTVEPAPSPGRRILGEIRGRVVTGGLMLFAGTAIGQPHPARYANLTVTARPLCFG
jgi:hypothetical protein